MWDFIYYAVLVFVFGGFLYFAALAVAVWVVYTQVCRNDDEDDGYPPPRPDQLFRRHQE